MSIISFFRLNFSSDKRYIRALKNMLGFVPGNLSLYRLAFRHKSVAMPVKDGSKNSNERLEFLGDAVLGSVIAELLFKKYPYKGEGFLTELRSKIVSRAHLNQLAKKLGLNELIQYDTRMINYPYKHSSSLLGDAFEALIGAIYLDKGYSFTRNFLIKRIISPHVDINMLAETESNFKSRLIEWGQQSGKEVTFRLREPDKEEGYQKMFTVDAVVDGEVLGTGQDYNKKSAEKSAAEKAWEAIALQ